jgi:predicted membrane channel-forming protein YqfA (hemolysin III family)
VKKVLEMFLRQGYVLMGIGMALALAGIFFLVDPRRRVGPLRSVAVGVAIAGFVIYFVGRVCVSVERRTPRPPPGDDLEQGK